MAKRMFTVLVLAIVIAGVYWVFLSQGDRSSRTSNDDRPSETTEATTASAGIDETQLRFTTVNTYVDNFNVVHVYGEVTNLTKRECKEAVLRLNLYGKDDTLLKRLRVTVSTIPAGQTRTYDVEAGVFDGAVQVRPELVEVTF